LKPQIPWLRVFVEGVVIVGSILLAFGIDAWWDTRQEREEEQQILRGLQADFEANLQQLNEMIEAHMEFNRALIALESKADEELLAVPADSVDGYIRAITVAGTFNARDGTLDGVLASGNLDLIRMASLRDVLVAWKNMVEDGEEEATELREAGGLALQRMGEMGGPFRGPIPGGRTVQFPILSETMESFATVELTELANDPTLMALARIKRFRAAVYLAVVALPLAEHADSVLALLRVGRE